MEEAMEESKELQGFYKIFRTVVYVSVLLECFRVYPRSGDVGSLERHTLRYSWAYHVSNGG